ncbi:MAG: glycosyltransferase family 4 protein [Candidatus Taylorbacteria bacterium]
MNICYIYPGYPPENHSGGVGTFIEELVKTISKYGTHKIDIISRSDKYFDSIENLSTNVTLYRLGETPLAENSPVLLFRNEGFLRHYERVLEVVKMINGKNPIDVIEVADWGAEGFLVLKQFLDITLVRCHTPAFVSESYNPSSRSYLSDNIKSSEKSMLSIAKHIVCPSRSLIDEIDKRVHIGCVPKIELYPLDLGDIRTKQDYAITSNEIRLLSVGRIEERKGQDIIYQACQLISEQNKYNISLDLIGADTYVGINMLFSKYFIEKLVEKPTFKFRLLGEMSRKKVLEIYQYYDIYIGASRFDNYPYTLLEAMGAGLPVIGNNNSGISEIMIKNINGLTFAGNSTELANSINTLIQDQKLRAYIGENARSFIETKLTPGVVYRNVIRTYQNICKKE